MKRLVLTLSLLLAAGAAHAFDPTAEPSATRIGILRAPASYFHENAERVHATLRETLRSELRARGYEATLVERTFDDLDREEVAEVDFLVEIAGDSRSEERGGIGVGGPHASVTLGRVVADVAADVFVYDAATLEQLSHESLSKRDSAVMPTSIGAGGARIFAWIAAPILERAQVRGVARQLARDIASQVDGVVRSR